MRVFIENLKFQAIIGILESERETPQDVIINLMFDYNYKDGKFIDYVDIRDLIKRTVINMKFKLLEDALLHLSDLILQEYDIEYFKLKITKPSILPDAEVSVEVEQDFV